MRVRFGGVRFRPLAARPHDDGRRYTLAAQKCTSSEEVDISHCIAGIFTMTSRILMAKRLRTPTRQGSRIFISQGLGSLCSPLLALLLKLITFVQNPDHDSEIRHEKSTV